MSDTINLKRKLTVRDVVGNFTKPKEGEKPREIMTVIGVARGIRTGEDKFKAGEVFKALKGHFEATNLGSGEIFSAPECFLPEPLHSMITNQLEDPENKVDGVRFAATVTVEWDNSQIGYKYGVKPHVRPVEVDMLGDLRDSLPKLDAPKADTKTEKK